MVAIKVLQPKLVANPDYLERFTHEAHIAARLSHNNIVQAIDVGSAGNLHYFVMEYVEGTTIKQQLQDGKTYAEREALEIIVQIAQALAHAHRRGLIHRDIKPANIILTPEGIAKLADLGLARQTADDALAETEKGLVFGTPFYISPEQIYGQQDLDARADIYALGATLYHMVTGQPPFPYKDVSAVFKAHVNEELTPPDHLNTALSSGLGEVVEFMMANKPLVTDMTVQKLGANRAAVDQALGANNVEYVWKLDGTVQGQAKTYAQQMLELKQIRALPKFDTFLNPTFSNELGSS